MKHKIFLTIFVLIFTFGTAVLADYLEPTGTAPSNNTGDVLKTGPKSATLVTFEKIGIGDGTTITPNSLLSSGSYAGIGSNKGGFMEKLVVSGVTTISNPADFTVRVQDVNNSGFDQFTSSNVQFFDKIKNQNINSKPLQAYIAGRILGKLAITDNADTGSTKNYNPSYSLDFLATGTSNYAPTTNIGLGDFCDLYPVDLGKTVGDGGGCPAGSYMTMYKAPSFTTPVTSTNNTNSQVVATCTQFNPSISPKTLGRCSSARSASSAVSANFGNQVADKCYMNFSGCTVANSYKDGAYFGNGAYNPLQDCNYMSQHTWSITGSCPNGPVMNAPIGIKIDSYRCTNTVSISSNGYMKMPSPLSGNITWYLNGSQYNPGNDQTSVDGCGIDKVTVVDAYGQYVEKNK